MKHFYSKNNSGVYEKLLTGRDFDKCIEDHNKILVIGSIIYYVIEYTNSMSEEERKVFDYGELIHYLQKKQKNVYFFNTNKSLCELIMNDVRTKIDQTVVDYPVVGETIHTVKDGEILDIQASVDREIVRDAIRELYDKKLNDDGHSFVKVSLRELINNQELLELYNLPLIDKYNSFMIPPYGYTSASLFYILNGIYSKPGEKKYLSEKNLKDLFIESYSEDADIVRRVIDGIEVNIGNKYNLEEFSSSLDFLEEVKAKENDYSKGLDYAKEMLKRAKRNEGFIKELGILDRQKEDPKSLEKKPTTE